MGTSIHSLPLVLLLFSSVSVEETHVRYNFDNLIEELDILHDYHYIK